MSEALNHPHALSEGEEVSGHPGAGQKDGSLHKHPVPLPTADKQLLWLERIWGEVRWWGTAGAGEGKSDNMEAALPGDFRIQAGAKVCISCKSAPSKLASVCESPEALRRFRL